MLLGDFLKNVNRGVVSAIISKHKVPLHPEKEFTCFMADTHLHIDVCVNRDVEVTLGDEAVAKLHFDYVYLPEKEKTQDGE